MLIEQMQVMSSLAPLEHTHTHTHTHTYSGFPVTVQVRLSESPSRKMPEGGEILTVGATVGGEKDRGGLRLMNMHVRALT